MKARARNEARVLVLCEKRRAFGFSFFLRNEKVAARSPHPLLRSPQPPAALTSAGAGLPSKGPRILPESQPPHGHPQTATDGLCPLLCSLYLIGIARRCSRGREWRDRRGLSDGGRSHDQRADGWPNQRCIRCDGSCGTCNIRRGRARNAAHSRPFVCLQYCAVRIENTPVAERRRLLVRDRRRGYHVVRSAM